MTAVDLVKYAAFAPTPGDADHAMQTAMQFVKSTAAARSSEGLQPAMTAQPIGAGTK
jgi:hypothetical protein